jgi:substrate import-associated zinc metallohydrolase lipoprotein
MAACSEDEKFASSVFDTNPPARTELDNWIMDHLTKPYNIEIIYRWKYTESDLSRYITPAKEESVAQMVKIFNPVWTDPYVKIAGSEFFNRLCPKQLMLVGSSSYNSSGTLTLGTAEMGRKIVLYEVDEFDRKNKTRLKRYMKTIHHEFTHICNQVTRFDPSFELITAAGYRTDWNNVTLANAYNFGFITQYAQASPTEDFAEMVGIMLTTSAEEWNNILDNQPNNQEAKDALRAKEALVIKYYKEAWNFDIKELQAELEIAVDKFVNE